ncbi:LysM peptidoglycan-binding domain-containing protein [Fusibacter bizertensis]|jgi:LysM domain.|uniref:LysM peptidoglycan-binding domain-containing protein n=1 Tax=Fusibacter bizertensis TaxID=1488331 RepID=A0ABT6N822_9FIRM|nr:LysM peptidoglycan-binding domain-containing protein [Fusibacter bizertensis]MDH8676564.1 LysM peptidoglycan-binding domain-containing protein [Fusibacter bizertensis]
MNQSKNQMTFDYNRQSGYTKTKKRKRLYIVNRARFVIMTLITLILLSTIISYISGFIMSEAATNHTDIFVKVVAGDTLWDIASKYNFYEEDVRAVVYRIKEYNHMDESTLFIGQTIAVPTSNR